MSNTEKSGLFLRLLDKYARYKLKVIDSLYRIQ